MASLKSLFKDTAIYGMSSIVGRFLNYLLVPMYTNVIAASSGGYGIIKNIYSYVALLFVILTYGMETTFFRFMNKEGEDARTVYRTILTMVGCTSTLFVALVFLFINPITSWMGYADHPSYVWTMAIVIALDAFQAIPFAYLRYKKRPIKFAALKLLFIAMNIALNLLFFLVLYDPEIGAGYAFYINLACTSTITFFFWKELKEGFRLGKKTFDAEGVAVKSCWIDKALVCRMLSYSWPILVLGIAGILNQTADKILFRNIYTGADADVQLGIYGAAVKIAMIMAMITQAFRYAYEPFVFAGAKDKNSKEMYSKAMSYFIVFTLIAFLMVVGYMDILKYVIGKDYWEGLRVVPIVMAAEIMMGITFNLSFWYKLTDSTLWGAVLSGISCAVLLAVNIIFVPEYGYMACAWGGVAGYGTNMILSYLVGQKKYPVNYHLPSIFVYVVAAAVGFYVINFINGLDLALIIRLLLNTVVIAVFALGMLKVMGFKLVRR